MTLLGMGEASENDAQLQFEADKIQITPDRSGNKEDNQNEEKSKDGDVVDANILLFTPDLFTNKNTATYELS